MNLTTTRSPGLVRPSRGKGYTACTCFTPFENDTTPEQLQSVIDTTFLRLSSDGGKNSHCHGLVIVVYVTCFTFLGFTMKHFSLGTLYAKWPGLGVSLLALIGILFFGVDFNLLKIVSFALVIAGGVGLNERYVTLMAAPRY